MSFQDFQDDHCSGHLGYQNETILVILNLYVAPMPPIKIQLNPIYGLGGDFHLKIFKVDNMATILDIGRESQCHPSSYGSI